MLTFCDFYRVLVNAVNVRLYKKEGWEFPPKLNYKKSAAELAQLILDKVLIHYYIMLLKLLLVLLLHAHRSAFYYTSIHFYI